MNAPIGNSRKNETFLLYFIFSGAKAACGAKAGCEDITQANVSYKFGVVMTAAGLIGVPLGSYISQILRHNVPNADPIVCGATLMASVPVLFFGFFMARYSLYACFGLTFLAGNDKKIPNFSQFF